jgi:hypothetical protein
MSSLSGDVELWESVLVRIEDVEVVTEPNAYNEWVVADRETLTHTATIDDYLHNYSGDLSEGTAFSSITGPLHYSYGSYKIVPYADEACLP